MKAWLLIPIALGLGAAARAQTQFSITPLPQTLDGPASLFGVWGSDKQCQAHRDGSETNPARLPYVIGNQWIRQGFIYCYLFWRGHENTGGLTRAWADARCGEDDLRDYRLQFILGAQRLDIRWSPDFVASDLQSCRPATDNAG